MPCCAPCSTPTARATRRTTLDGQGSVPLKARQVQIFALALHELATNAVKHGALASPPGRLAARWRLDDATDGQELHVDWRESGVHTNVATVGSGYGRELIERALPYQLDARTSYELTGDGVHCTITVPMADAA
jgi:two-component sensor histidine kinase